MAQQYFVELGGAHYELRYRMDDREWIESQFTRPDGTPGGLGSLLNGHLARGGSLAVQAVIIAGGLRHLNNKRLTAEKIKEHIFEHSKNGGASEILTPAFKAVLASGVLGVVVEDEKEADEGEGKAETPEA